MTAEQIVLVGGLWLDGSAWDDVVSELDRRGRTAVPVTLPADATATLDDQVAAVLAAVDASPDRSIVVGHSAACTLAWLAADARPGRVAKVVLIGGFPGSDGKPYFQFLPLQDGVLPFPGWAAFEGPDSADLDDAARAEFARKAIPVPGGVTQGIVRLTDERRFDVPVVVVCPEFTPDQAREWIASGDVPELARAKHVDLVDIDSGHWPMLTRASELAAILAATRQPASG